MPSAIRFCLALVSLLVASPLLAQLQQPGDAARLVHASGIQGGLVVHVGCGDATWTAGLRVNERFLVQGLESDPRLVAEARRRLLSEGRLGPVSVRHWMGECLPYADNLVNLLIVSRASRVDRDELQRVLLPGGVAVTLGDRHTTAASFRKPWPDDIDQWTHFLHGPDNNAVANDTRVAPPHHLQWTVEPRWGRSHDQLGSLSAAVSAGGRLFYIVDEGSTASVKEPARWMLVARDAFNGILLWKRPVGLWENHLRPFRSGPAALPRRLIAVDDLVYVTLGYGQPVSALDAATGALVRCYDGTEHTQEILCSDGKLYVVAGSHPATRSGAPVPELPEWLVPYPQSVHTFPPKHLVCVNGQTGDLLWKRQDRETANLLPLTLAIDQRRIFFHNEQELVALDAESGKTLWKSPRPVSLHRYAWSSPTLVVQDGVVLSGDRTAEEKMDLGQADGKQPRWLVSSGHDLFGGEIIAFSAETGKRLWSAPCHENFNAPVDVFVVRGRVWSGEVAWTPQPGITRVYDLHTGEVVATRPPDHEFGKFGHHRCYRAKATLNYVLHSRRGIEFVDMDSDQLLVDRWLRGTCQYGILPCNGLIYTPPHSCACYVTHHLNSFNALSANQAPTPDETAPRLQRGPAFGKTRESHPATTDTAQVPNAISPPPPPPPLPHSDVRLPHSNAWPTYRAAATRSGATPHGISLPLTTAWQQSFGAPLTPPVIAEGRVFVAQPRTDTLLALHAADGSRAWSFSAGAPIDSAPTIYGGEVYFGSADGWVYCLRATDGCLVWQYRAAPKSRQIISYGRLESAWPLPGSLLVYQPGNGPATVYGVAGRSTYLDDGLVLFGLDAATGDLRFEKRLYCPSPESAARKQAGANGSIKLDVLPDILSTDGSHLFMRHQAFDLDGNPTSQKIPHLFCSAGFRDDTWWHRTYWQYGADMSSGFGAWIAAGNTRISGRLLVRRDSRFFGFGRKDYQKSGSHPGLGAQHHLFSAEAPPAPKNAGKDRRTAPDGKSQVRYDWSVDVPFYGRAMVLAGDQLFVAGPSRIADLDAVPPDGDVWMWVVAAADGRKLAEYRLPSAPVFDALAVGDGCLLLSTVDGQLTCYRPQAPPTDANKGQVPFDGR